MHVFFDRFDAIVSWAIGFVLLLSGAVHLSNPYQFLATVYSYGLVGPRVGWTIAVALPPLQIIVSTCLLCGVFADSAHWVAMLMLACFLAAQGLVFSWGLDISCGCFGPSHEMRIGAASLSIVFGLLLLSVVRNAWWLRSSRRSHLA